MRDTATDQRALLRGLCRMWERRDPPPPGLADDLVAFLAAGDLTVEWALLELTRGDLVGVRASSEVQTFEFELGSVALVVRVAPETASSGRVDGWFTHAERAADAAVTLVTDREEQNTTLDENGRFEFPGVRGRRLRLRIEVADGERVETPEIHFRKGQS